VVYVKVKHRRREMKKLLVVLVAVLLASCVTYEYRFNLRSLELRMPAEQVLELWGPPSDINRTVISTGDVSEQWVYYYTQYDAIYLYFENGRLTGWQD
jgi:hypothetical protein